MSGAIGVAVFAGLFATIAFDLWQRLVHLATGIPPSNWAMVGRWFGHMPRGRFAHAAIAAADPVRNELALGWTMHYLIGILYGFAYMGMTGLLAAAPSPANGFLFGLASVVVPWFLMAPALGLGVMARKAPNPNVPRYSALAGHCVFGIALYAGAAVHGAIGL